MLSKPIQPSLVVIHYHRPGKGITQYVEGLVEDDGIRLHTYTQIPEAERRLLDRALVSQGLIPSGSSAASIRKFFFYREYFDILEFRDSQGGLLGYYSDIATPLTKIDGRYHMTDLSLDLWLYPDGRCLELDLDEFEQSVADRIITDEQACNARQTFERLKAELEVGKYPDAYIPNPWKGTTRPK
jgi:predicted RNA-binding protein associated with RNAse of E/G family